MRVYPFSVRCHFICRIEGGKGGEDFSAFVVFYFYEVMLTATAIVVAPCCVKCGSEQKQKLTLTKSSDLRAQRSINTHRE